MGTLGTIAISLLLGATIGVFGLAIFIGGSGTVRNDAAKVKDYCCRKECWTCKFHSAEAPYCKVGYPITWDIDYEEDEE